MHHHRPDSRERGFHDRTGNPMDKGNGYLRGEFFPAHVPDGMGERRAHGNLLFRGRPRNKTGASGRGTLIVQTCFASRFRGNRRNAGTGPHLFRIQRGKPCDSKGMGDTDGYGHSLRHRNHVAARKKGPDGAQGPAYRPRHSRRPGRDNSACALLPFA